MSAHLVLKAILARTAAIGPKDTVHYLLGSVDSSRLTGMRQAADITRPAARSDQLTKLLRCGREI